MRETKQLSGYALAEEENTKRVSFVALSEGVHNGVFYPSDEIEKSTNDIIGKPIRINHTDNVMETIGKIVDAKWVNENGFKRIECIGEFYSDTSTQREAISLLTKGLITDFSVGVDVDLTMERGVETAKDLKFKEVSLVTEGADEMAKVITLLNSKSPSNRELLDLLTKIANRGENVEKKLEGAVPEVKEEEIKSAGPTQDIAPEVDAQVQKPKAELSLETLSDVLSKINARLGVIEAKLEKSEEEPEEKEKKPEEKEMKNELAEMKKKLELMENEKVKKSKILANEGKTSLRLVETKAGFQSADQNTSPFGQPYGIQRRMR